MENQQSFLFFAIFFFKKQHEFWAQKFLQTQQLFDKREAN